MAHPLADGVDVLGYPAWRKVADTGHASELGGHVDDIDHALAPIIINYTYPCPCPCPFQHCIGHA